MKALSSKREGALWMGALAVVLAIYSTLGVARTLVDFLRDSNLLEITFALVVVLLVGAIGFQWMKQRPGWRDLGVGLGIALAYGMVFVRMENPAERTHLIEYGIVAALIHQALLERIANGFPVRNPAAVTVIATAGVGFFDECIQGAMVGRVFDWNDVFFNALAGFMVVVARLALIPVRLPGWRFWFLWFLAGAVGWGICMDVGTFGQGRRFVLLSFLPSIDLPKYESVAAGGILVAVFQGLLLRSYTRKAWHWILAAIKASVCGGLVVWVVGVVNPNLGWVIGVLCYGLMSGLLQWQVLRSEWSRVGGWIVVCGVAWIVAIPIGDLGGPPGWSVYGAMTGAYMVWLLRRQA